jgi:hypothetical protein
LKIIAASSPVSGDSKKDVKTFATSEKKKRNSTASKGR